MARPSKPKLSTDGIAKAALKLVDRHGEFTIPQLARELSVTASSLYNHVGGKDEIIELMRGRAMSAVALPEARGAQWQDEVRGIAVAYWRSYSRHPRLIPLLTSYTVRDRTTLRVYDALVEALSAAHFAPGALLRAVTIIDSFVIGSALDAAAPQDVWEADAESSTAFRQALKEGLGEENRAEATFLDGLEIILSGLESQLVDKSRNGEVPANP